MPSPDPWDKANEHHRPRSPEEVDEAVLRARLRIEIGAPAFAADLPDALLYALGRESPLSPKEREYLRAASHGLSVEMIAEAYGVSYFTVQTQLRRARHRLQAKNTTHAVALAIRAGLF